MNRLRRESAAPPEAPEPSRGPLDGFRVVDCSSVLAGPFATMVLADLGADVVKVESPEGDVTRGWGPPWVGSTAKGTRTAAYYLAVNRNKRSIRVNLKAPDGAEVLRKLLLGADVFVENLRPGSLARLGFSDETLEEMSPRLVHLSISGYGPIGHAADRPGYDLTIQAAGGLMSITGDSDSDGGRPLKVGVAVSDVATGLYAVIGVLAGLLARDCSRPMPDGGSRSGQRIDASLLASTLAILVNQGQNAFAIGRSPGRRGNSHPNIVPYETFETADGEVAVAVGSERQWRRFCDALGLQQIADDPMFATNGVRVENRTILRPIIGAVFEGKSTAHWVKRLNGADVPCGAVAGVLEAFESPEAKALSMMVDVEHPVLGMVRQAGVPLLFQRTPGAVRTAPPLLGEDTDDVLGELGYDSASIADLHRRGVV